MKVGDPVVVVADWSSFKGMHGRIVETAPHLMVVMDDDPRPIRVGWREVLPVAGESHPLMVAGD